jgi:hypothetical protein
MNICVRKNKGISVIEVMIAFAVTSMLLAYTLPSALEQGIRSRVEIGLSSARPAQQALLNTCQTNDKAMIRNNLDAGYSYIPTGSSEDYMDKILLGADCAKESMVIMIWTSSTGAPTDPVIELTANELSEDAAWTCRLIQGDLRYVPSVCHNSYKPG